MAFKLNDLLRTIDFLKSCVIVNRAGQNGEKSLTDLKYGIFVNLCYLNVKAKGCFLDIVTHITQNIFQKSF